MLQSWGQGDMMIVPGEGVDDPGWRIRVEATAERGWSLGSALSWLRMWSKSEAWVEWVLMLIIFRRVSSVGLGWHVILDVEVWCC